MSSQCASMLMCVHPEAYIHMCVYVCVRLHNEMQGVDCGRDL